jgi:ankyrin repeat protein
MRAGSSSPLCILFRLVTDNRLQMLVAAGAERDRSDDDGYTPLACAIVYGQPYVAEFLFHSGAKMSNIPRVVKVPAWTTDIIAKRCNTIIAKRQLIMSSTLVLKGLLKRRLGLSKDVAHLIAIYFWSMRLK